MKKIMGMMLGMSLLMGTVALFADDAPPKKEATSTTKTKKTKKTKTKKTAVTSTEKKS
jgi:hypothetical protein